MIFNTIIILIIIFTFILSLGFKQLQPIPLFFLFILLIKLFFIPQTEDAFQSDSKYKYKTEDFKLLETKTLVSGTHVNTRSADANHKYYIKYEKGNKIRAKEFSLNNVEEHLVNKKSQQRVEYIYAKNGNEKEYRLTRANVYKYDKNKDDKKTVEDENNNNTVDSLFNIK